MLSINQLHQQINEREKRKQNVYEKILKLCYNKILATNKKTEDCHCFFSCPHYVHGLPLYNILNCTVYIMEDLKNKGFKVEYINPNILYIDWKVNPGNKSSNQSLPYSSSHPKIEYDQFRDIMDMHSNTGMLYGQQQYNNAQKVYKDELNDMDFF